MSVELRLGPMLRHVTESSATVWVETDTPGTVTVIAGHGHTERRASTETFTVHGHHFALCDLDGLPSGHALPYRVLLDDTQVWPQPGAVHPPSLIRTLDPDAPVRIAFGSCHRAAPHTTETDTVLGVDMLRSYAARLARERSVDGAPSTPVYGEPSVLLLLGDQVYADEVTEGMQAFLQQRRAAATPERRQADPPADEVVFFDEYAELYRQAWSDPDLRWLLSTVPTLMLFDDHDVRDDWNTSGSWRQNIAEQPWWRSRITSGLGAYWVYQHLGNLSAKDRDADPVLSSVHRTEGDAAAVVDEFAWRAHELPGSYQWSYRFDIANSRVLMLDTRCGRIVDNDAHRTMQDPDTEAWLAAQLTGDVDHLILASSLPFLLPTGVHYLEAWNEAVCAGRWGAGLRGTGERLRQAFDLEHWPAFHASFQWMSDAVLDLASGQRGPAPASVLFLGGDVHFSYLATAYPRQTVGGVAPIVQLVCSPTRNRLPTKLRWATWLAARRITGWCTALMARLAGVGAPALRWRIEDGPHYENTVATLVLRGRSAEVYWEHPALPGTTGAPATSARPGSEVRELTHHTLTD
ncbi:alkaline phosphatase D family protein [Lipingzhangella sp. LS1_29]|uniref:Alkaline phosphatase D family protein n=1 Tax=Lipingzhangella rawalii TaxID=2055835 RepID=A0ABU2H1B8_9ACTN|nr:alkaline phosphatase D family protein [Lipingzhangella rawalii]MDS1268787.1 alkaline phosphatase D family protein [Lipingzhangella rawalii]